MSSPPSDKSRAIALVLGITLGMFGGHRFYAGKIGTGLLMLFTSRQRDQASRSDTDASQAQPAEHDDAEVSSP